MLRTIAFAAAIAVGSPASAPAQAGNWTIHVNVDPLTDREIGIAALQPTSKSVRENIQLMARCKNNETEVWIEWNNFINTDASHPVTIRVGKQPPRTVRMGTSTDHTATFIGEPVAFLRSLAGSETVVFQTEPYSESPVTAVFGVEGVETDLAPLANMCGWSFAPLSEARTVAGAAAKSTRGAAKGTACVMQMTANDPRVQGALEVEGGAVYRVTARSTLNMRQSPSSASKVVAELCRDELVVGLERQGEWMLLVAPARGLMGYVAAKWLRLGD